MLSYARRPIPRWSASAGAKCGSSGSRTPLLIETWLHHQRRDDYWQHGSVCEDYEAIESAVLAVGGWADGYTNAVPQLVANIRKAPVKGLVGPWLHTVSRISPCPAPPSASSRKPCAGGTAASRARTPAC